MLQAKRGKENLEKILRIIERLQKASPYQPVRKRQVEVEIQKIVSIEPKLKYRTITRAFGKLCKSNKLKKVGRGQYWLPEFWDKTMEYQKQVQRVQEEKIIDMSNFLEKDVVEVVTKFSCREIFVRNKLLGLLFGDGTYEKWKLEDVFSGKDLQQWQDIFGWVKALLEDNSKLEELKSKFFCTRG
jgi:hypothetical protein